jgi:hypothetical protein
MMTVSNRTKPSTTTAIRRVSLFTTRAIERLTGLNALEK